jgi:hypothetical protein
MIINDLVRLSAFQLALKMILTDGSVILICFFGFMKKFVVSQLQDRKAASRGIWCYSVAFIFVCCAHIGNFSDSYVFTFIIAS